MKTLWMDISILVFDPSTLLLLFQHDAELVPGLHWLHKSDLSGSRQRQPINQQNKSNYRLCVCGAPYVLWFATVVSCTHGAAKLVWLTSKRESFNELVQILQSNVMLHATTVQYDDSFWDSSTGPVNVTALDCWSKLHTSWTPFLFFLWNICLNQM